MPFDVASDVLLLSSFPEAHQEQIDGLRRSGAVVTIATGPQQALALLARSTPLVLVDLVHGPAVNAEVVETLNRARGSNRVVALHAGDLGRFERDVADLAVDGFFRDHDWASLRRCPDDLR